MSGEFQIYCDDEEIFSCEKARALEKGLLGVTASDIPLAVEVCFVGEQEIRRLNGETRGVDKVTDVLSYPALDNVKGKTLRKKDFPLDVDENGNLFIGSIAVCVERAREQAEEYGHSMEREVHYLIVHGVMHCLGYDHMTDEEKAEMREKEELVLGKLGILRK